MLQLFPWKVAMKGASLAENTEIAEALVELLNQGKGEQEVLETRRTMIQEWLQNQANEAGAPFVPVPPIVASGAWDERHGDYETNDDGSMVFSYNAFAMPSGCPWLRKHRRWPMRPMKFIGTLWNFDLGCGVKDSWPSLGC